MTNNWGFLGVLVVLGIVFAVLWFSSATTGSNCPSAGAASSSSSALSDAARNFVADPFVTTADPNLRADRAQEVIPNLFLGPGTLGRDNTWLVAHNIKRVLNVGARKNQHAPAHITCTYIDLPDLPTADIARHFLSTYQYIDETLCRGERVYVHCEMGISRSVTIVCSYLMKKYRISSLDALKHVQRIRPCASPNLGFQKQLHDYYLDQIRVT